MDTVTYVQAETFRMSKAIDRASLYYGAIASDTNKHSHPSYTTCITVNTQYGSTCASQSVVVNSLGYAGVTTNCNAFHVSSNDQSFSDSSKTPIGKTHISIGIVNVCGLASKCHVPEFLNFVESFDIEGIQGSKTDDTDTICIPGYQIGGNSTSC